MGKVRLDDKEKVLATIQMAAAIAAGFIAPDHLDAKTIAHVSVDIAEEILEYTLNGYADDEDENPPPPPEDIGGIQKRGL